MYQLKQSTRNRFEEISKSEEKESHNVYLKRKHWSFLDELANHSGSSRNKALREILDAAMEGSEDVR